MGGDNHTDQGAGKTAGPDLSRGEGTLGRIMDLAPMAIAIHNRSGKVEYVNARFTRTFGYTLQDIPDKDRWAAQAAPDPAYRSELLARWTDGIRKAAAGNGEIEGSDYRIACKDGTVKTVRIFGLLAEDRAFVLFDDITERAEAETRLRESEATLRHILDLAPMSMAIVNIDGTIEYINQKAVETFGFPHAEIPNMDRWWAQAYPDEAYRKEVTADWMGRVYKAFEAKTEIEGSEYRVTCKDGKVKTCRIFGVIAANKVFVMFDDVTARVQAQQDLRERERSLRSILEMAPVAIGLRDARTGDLDYLNEAFTATFGYTREDILSFRDWVRKAVPNGPSTEEWKENWDAMVAAVKANGGAFPADEYEITCKDGSVRTAILRGVLTPEGKLLGIFEDVTARTQTLRNLRESEGMLRRILEQAPIAIGIRHENGDLDFVNAKFRQTFGYADEEQRTIEDWVRLAYPDPAYREQARAQWERSVAAAAKEGGEISGGEYRIACKDGAVKTIYIYGIVTQDRKLLCLFEDITEKVKAQTALKEGEATLRQILEQAPLGIAIQNFDNGLEFINRKFTEYFGYTIAEIPTLAAWAERAYPDKAYRDRLVAGQRPNIEKAMRTNGEMDPVEVVVNCKDGSKKNVLVTGVVTSGRKIVSLLEDITARVQAENAIRESEAMLRRILERAPIAIMVASLDGKIEFFNHKQVEAFGYTLEDAPDQASLLRLAYPDDKYREEVQRRWTAGLESAVRAGKEMEAAEFQIRTKGGEKRTISTTGVVMPDKRIIVLTEDITARVATEKALRESESRYRALVETTRTGYVIINKEGRVLDANTEYVRLTGRKDLKEVLGRTVLDWTAPHEKEKNAAAVARCARDGYIRDFEIDYITPEGRINPIEINASVVTREGVPQIATLCRDISARRRTEEEIRGLNQNLENRVEERTAELTAANEELVSEIEQRMKAERAKDALQEQLLQSQKLEAVGRLAGGIAHDFNNILVSISGYAELLRDTMPQGSPARGDLAEILLETERGAALTRQLLTFSAKQTIKFETVNINEVAAGSEKMLRRIIGSNMHLECRLAGDLWPVKADPSQISQVIINLVINARDAMPSGGRIILETRNVRLAGDAPGMRLTPPPGDYAELSVTDTGAGMPPEVMSHVFEPFFTTKKPGQGTGLGLSTVYGIVSGAKGGIALESAPGKGTTLRVCLPRTSGRTDGVKEGARGE